MKNTAIFFLALFSSFSLMSCFEISEELNLKNDGSGTAILTLNFKESKDNLAAYMEKGTIEGVKLPSKYQIELGLKKMQFSLENTPGLSNVQIQSDFDDYVFVVRSDFKDTGALNKAINHLAETLNDSNYPLIKKDNFSYSGDKFNRIFSYPVADAEYGKLSKGYRMILESAKIVSIYRFEKRIKNFSNRNARLSPSKKAIMMIQNIGELALGKTSIANQILF